MSTAILEHTEVPFFENVVISNPEVTFNIIKSAAKLINLTPSENHSEGLEALTEQKKQADIFGQEVLSEGLQRRIDSIIIKNNIKNKVAKIQSAGYVKYLSKKTVEAFQRVTPATFLDNLKNFNRPVYVPGDNKGLEGEKLEQDLQRKKASELIAQAIESKVFDEIMILNIDYPRLEEEKKAQRLEAQRLENIARDPIAFGVCNDLPDFLFFIADWIDERCNLTFDKVVDSIISNNLQ